MFNENFPSSQNAQEQLQIVESSSSTELYEFLPEEIFQLDQPIKNHQEPEPIIYVTNASLPNVQVSNVPAENPAAFHGSYNTINPSNQNITSPHTLLDLDYGSFNMSGSSCCNTSSYKYKVNTDENYHLPYRNVEINNNSGQQQYNESVVNFPAVNPNIDDKTHLQGTSLRHQLVHQPINSKTYTKKKYCAINSFKTEDSQQQNSIIFNHTNFELPVTASEPTIYYENINHLTFSSTSYMHLTTTKSNLMNDVRTMGKYSNCVNGYK